MAVTNKVTAKDLAINRFKPQVIEHSKKETSNYFPKDEIFNKTKTYLRKGKEGEHFLDADWRNLHIGGKKIVLHKGVALSNDELKQFNSEAKKHYLVASKTKAIKSDIAETTEEKA